MMSVASVTPGTWGRGRVREARKEGIQRGREGGSERRRRPGETEEMSVPVTVQRRYVCQSLCKQTGCGSVRCLSAGLPLLTFVFYLRQGHIPMLSQSHSHTHIQSEAPARLLSEVVHQLAEVRHRVLPAHVLEHLVRARLHWDVQEAVHPGMVEDAGHLLREIDKWIDRESVCVRQRW